MIKGEIMCYIKLVFVCALISICTVQADVLDNYIRIGLEQNLSLQEKTFSLQKSMAALREAKGMFMPSVSLEARFTRAEGGRVIDIPIGDLMNPIYQILQSPIRLENESIPFLREKEHETKLRIIQPLYQPKLVYNYKIHQEMRDIAAFEKTIFMRQLIYEIQSAYFQYLKSEQLVVLLAETQVLLKENLRVSQSLCENEKVTQDAVYLAQAELFAIEEEAADAVKNRILTMSYFNFLLHRPLDTEIKSESVHVPEVLSVQTLEQAVQQSLQRREELKQISEVIKISQHQKGLAKAGFLPGIAALIDYGYEGETCKFDDQHNYWMASVAASWNLFNGFQDQQKIQQAVLSERENKARLEALKIRLQLQTQEAYYTLQVAWKKIKTANEREKAAVKSYKIVARKFKEGMAPHIEYMHARTKMTQAQVNAIISIYDFQINKAAFEKVTADYPIPQVKE